jgi:signal transduction histidine kinase
VTIARRLGVGYAWISAACLVLVTWLGYHEFIEEPASFAALGLSKLHQDTQAELATVSFLASIPVLLGLFWWWMRRVLAPLGALAAAVDTVHSHNLQQPLPRSMNGDEVDTLTAVFNSMTARLDGSFRRIHEFTLHASHELKTPLTVMRMQLETALRDVGSLPSGQSHWIDSQIDEVKRLTQIVDSLTLLTRADAGLMPLENLAVRLDGLVEEAFEDALILAQHHHLQVMLGTCERTMVSGDRHRLRQLLLILTDNAVKYNRPHGTISIALRRVADAAEMRITNTGSGIAPKTLEHVFERFVRGENAQGHVEGCGLGLAIAEWIVRAHGGSIRLIPEPDEQITALVRIPILSASVPIIETTPLASSVA